MAGLATLFSHSQSSFTESSQPLANNADVTDGLPEVQMFSSNVGGTCAGAYERISSTVHSVLHKSPAPVVCCTSSKHFRSSSTVDPMTADELAMMCMKTRDMDPTENGNGSDIILVDCRTFLAFNTNHVAGAFNASCGDRFSRKRLMQGRATVADLVTGGPGTASDEIGGVREMFRKLAARVAASPSGLFVAYDDNTTDLEKLQESHPLRLLTASLTSSGYWTKYLAGGLQSFYACYSGLCSKPNERPSPPFLYSPTTPVVELDVDSAEISAVLPFLFIGNERDAANRQLLQDHGIDHVLNVTSHIPLHFADDVTVTYLRIPASDSGCQNLKQYFDQIVAFIESARCSGGKVLVHCQAGVSRSPTIVVAYIMARYGRTMMDSFQLVKQHRPIVAPNFNFMGQLLDFEQRCKRGELQSSVDDRVVPPPLSQSIPSDSLQ